MIQSYDVGSLPPPANSEKFCRLAKSYNSLKRQRYPDEYAYFTDVVLTGFKDKLDAGVDIPNYPQYRDMNEMFLDMIRGIEKTTGGYVVTGTPSVTSGNAKIQEVSVIREKRHEIRDAIGRPFRLKVCITGPYTLASLFRYRSSGIHETLGSALSTITEENTFDEKDGSVELVAIDEPVFGFLNDPMLDRGSSGRERLLSAWDGMLHKVKSKGAKAILHLHNTSDDLFWDLKNLDVIESHVDDPIYKTERTKQLLNDCDKFLKAPIAVTRFDDLIAQKICSNDPELAGGEWEKIRKGRVDSAHYLESAGRMGERLKGLVEFFGEERVPYAGPECGLGGHPTYECAVECLRRQSEAVRKASGGT